jgi:hypothetical protein
MLTVAAGYMCLIDSYSNISYFHWYLSYVLDMLIVAAGYMCLIDSYSNLFDFHEKV